MNFFARINARKTALVYSTKTGGKISRKFRDCLKSQANQSLHITEF